MKISVVEHGSIPARSSFKTGSECKLTKYRGIEGTDPRQAYLRSSYEQSTNECLANAIALYHDIPNVKLTVPLQGSTNISGSRGPERSHSEPPHLEILVHAQMHNYTAMLYQKTPHLVFLTRGEPSPTVAVAMLSLLQVLAHRLHDVTKNLLTVPEGREVPLTHTELIFRVSLIPHHMSGRACLYDARKSLVMAETGCNLMIFLTLEHQSPLCLDARDRGRGPGSCDLFQDCKDDFDGSDAPQLSIWTSHRLCRNRFIAALIQKTPSWKVLARAESSLSTEDAMLGLITSMEERLNDELRASLENQKNSPCSPRP
nr:hypothetical protein CFP56_09451 [Quercus suber]